MNTLPEDLSGLTDRGAIKVLITSFGALHQDPPSGDAITVDLTKALHNPHTDPKMRTLTGLDHAVRRHMETTPGSRAVVERTVDRVLAAMAYHDGHGELTEVHVYCQGGRHRSVWVAEETAAHLRALGIGVEVEHRHIFRGVVQP
ncbi:RapZ C-terminal domain-containing protein [Nocardiopsis ansamitocini]|uniref:RapZ C-terminal domain-containing protein n=1 Tax=Nocardiopsis ansamitocini TaxID=1670832 RepID=A0A9W6UHF7_9ACTN|nr:RNase adapter RapZ [Nocardiopsis ansamitocini]GLU46308.1 hypothetical protein Nans01_06590 [Nocardiopsis ansamitocini]